MLRFFGQYVFEGIGHRDQLMTHAPSFSPCLYEATDYSAIEGLHHLLCGERHSGRDCAEGTSPGSHRYVLSEVHTGEQAEIPTEIRDALTQLVEALRNDMSVTISAVGITVTAEHAAEILGVRRPLLNGLLASGELPSESAGTQRKIFLHDVRDLREKRKSERYTILASLPSELDDHTPVEDVVDELKVVRRVVAERRLSARSGTSSP